MEEDQFTALPGRLMNLTKGKTGRPGESTRYGQAEGQKEDELTAPDVQSGEAIVDLDRTNSLKKGFGRGQGRGALQNCRVG